MGDMSARAAHDRRMVARASDPAHLWTGTRSKCGLTFDPKRERIIRTPRGYQPFCTICKPPSEPRGAR